MKKRDKQKTSELLREMTAQEYKQMQMFGFVKATQSTAEDRAEVSKKLKAAGASAPRFLVVKHRFYTYDFRKHTFAPEEEPAIIRGLLFRGNLYTRPRSCYIFGKDFETIETCEGVPDWASGELVRLAKYFLRG